MNLRSITFAVMLLVPLFDLAWAGVVCVTSDGKVHAVDRPPPGCEVKPKYRGLLQSSRMPSSPRDSSAVARRGEIEREADEVSHELSALHARLAAIPEVSPAAYANDPAGWQAYEQDLAARDAAAERLRGRESALQWRLAALKRDFDALTVSLASGHAGRIPRWWGPLRCAKCP